VYSWGERRETARADYAIHTFYTFLSLDVFRCKDEIIGMHIEG